jgi:hypothetical protein
MEVGQGPNWGCSAKKKIFPLDKCLHGTEFENHYWQIWYYVQSQTTVVNIEKTACKDVCLIPM